MSLSGYVEGYIERGLSVAGNPVGWAFYEANTIRNLVFWYLFSGVALLAWHREVDDYGIPLVPALAVTVCLLSTPRLIR